MEVVFFDKQDPPQLACRMKSPDEISTWEKEKQGTKLIFSSKFVLTRVSPPDLDFPYLLHLYLDFRSYSFIKSSPLSEQDPAILLH
jgi:hypothetical protein